MSAGCEHFTFPRPGFATRERAWSAAVFFTAQDLPVGYFRDLAAPGDEWLRELDLWMQQVAADGMTPQDCRDILAAAKVPPALVPAPRTSPEAGMTR